MIESSCRPSDEGGITMKQLILCALILLCWAASSVYGTPITDPSQLSPNPTIIDFEDIDTGGNLLTSLPNPATFGEVTFTSLTGTLSIYDISLSTWSIPGGEVASKTLFPGAEPDSAISITFAHPVAEFLLGWGDPNYPGNVLRAYDVNGNLLEEAAVALGPPGNTHAAWIGFKRSTADIATIIVQPDQSLPNGDDYAIDNIHYNTAVPGTEGVEMLSPAKLWIGLKNSDAVGLRLDLKAEVFLNETKVGEGQLNNVSSGSSGFNNAKLNAIAMSLLNGSVEVPPDAELALQLSVRRTCFGGGHNSGSPRLWFNDAQANSHFGATIADETSELFLRSGFVLANTPGPGPKKTIDVVVNSQAACPNRPFTPFGTWNLALP